MLIESSANHIPVLLNSKIDTYYIECGIRWSSEQQNSLILVYTQIRICQQFVLPSNGLSTWLSR